MCFAFPYEDAQNPRGEFVAKKPKIRRAHCTQIAAGSPLGCLDVQALVHSPARGNGHGQIQTSGGCTGGGPLNVNADGDLNDQANAGFTPGDFSFNDQLNAGFTDGDFFYL